MTQIKYKKYLHLNLSQKVIMTVAMIARTPMPIKTPKMAVMTMVMISKTGLIVSVMSLTESSIGSTYDSRSPI